MGKAHDNCCNLRSRCIAKRLDITLIITLNQLDSNRPGHCILCVIGNLGRIQKVLRVIRAFGNIHADMLCVAEEDRYNLLTGDIAVRIKAAISNTVDNPIFRSPVHRSSVPCSRLAIIKRRISNSIFLPNGNTTRAQAAKVLFEMADSEEVPFSNVFKDVKSTNWFTPAVMWAHKNGVIKGYEDGTFRPDSSITRQDMVVLLYRYLGSPTVNGNALSGFADSEKVADYAKNAMEWAAEEKVLSGYEDNTLRPYSNISRAELATLIVRFYEQFVLRTVK